MLKRKAGVRAALLSAGFFGLTPIFGKLAVNFGISPLAVVGFRTIMATLLLLLLTAIINKKYLYIYPAGIDWLWFSRSPKWSRLYLLLCSSG